MSNQQSEIIRSFESEIKNCEAIIELGANVGLITKKILLHNKPLYAFEPEPEAFKHLSLIESPYLTKINKAAWIENGHTLLYRHKDWLETKSSTSSSLNITKTNVDNKNSVRCETVDIAEYILSLNKRVIIKMDIEGAEYDVINHLLDKNALEKIERIYCEFHPKKIQFGYFQHYKLKIRLFFKGYSNRIKNWF